MIGLTTDWTQSTQSQFKIKYGEITNRSRTNSLTLMQLLSQRNKQEDGTEQYLKSNGNFFFQIDERYQPID